MLLTIQKVKMPYKYIGKTHDLVGKTLWEIVGNLKNFGVGRIVARNMFERYPEPSYYKILKVETLPNPETPTHDDVRKVRVVVEKTFRGQTLPKPVTIEGASYKPDYKLIPKDQELEYCKNKCPPQQEKIVDRNIDFPPLMKELVKRELIANGKPLSEMPKMNVVLRGSMQSRYRLAKEGEKSNIELIYGIGKTKYPDLYKGT